MPNAKDFDPLSQEEKILMLGFAGAGKTTQEITLPGKTFAYIFDPNAVQSIRGHDIDYEVFASDVTDIDLAIKSLKSGVGDASRRKVEPKAYTLWEADFDERFNNKFFDDYDNVVFDSITTFADNIMDRVLFLNGRLGKQPEQADWAAQVNTISNVFRALTGLKKTIYCTGHLELRQNETSKKTFNHIMMPGKCRIRLPLLFTNIWFAFADKNEKGETRYWIQTRPDRETPHMRSSIKGLDEFEDITIDDFDNPQKYGIGAILTKARAAMQPAPAASKKVANSRR